MGDRGGLWPRGPSWGLRKGPWLGDLTVKVAPNLITCMGGAGRCAKGTSAAGLSGGQTSRARPSRSCCLDVRVQSPLPQPGAPGSILMGTVFPDGLGGVSQMLGPGCTGLSTWGPRSPSDRLQALLMGPSAGPGLLPPMGSQDRVSRGVADVPSAVPFCVHLWPHSSPGVSHTFHVPNSLTPTAHHLPWGCWAALGFPFTSPEHGCDPSSSSAPASLLRHASPACHPRFPSSCLMQWLATAM